MCRAQVPFCVVKLIVEHAAYLVYDVAENAFGGAIGGDGIVTLAGGVFRNNSAVVARGAGTGRRCVREIARASERHLV